MSPKQIDVTRSVRRLESNASQLSTAIHWLSASLIEEARGGRSLGLAMAAQMNGPVRALSAALLNLNEAVSGLLVAAEAELRDELIDATTNDTVRLTSDERHPQIMH